MMELCSLLGLMNQWEYIIFLPAQTHMCTFFAYSAAHRVLYIYVCVYIYSFFFFPAYLNSICTTGELVFLVLEN